jgi:hypothetical protein
VSPWDSSFPPTDDDIVDPISMIARIAGFSPSTFRRMEEAGEAPPIVHLSRRRKGVRRRDWRAWLASRTRRPVPSGESTGEKECS